MLPAYYRPEQAASSYLWENINEALINNGLVGLYSDTMQRCG